MNLAYSLLAVFLTSNVYFVFTAVLCHYYFQLCITRVIFVLFCYIVFNLGPNLI